MYKIINIYPIVYTLVYTHLHAHLLYITIDRHPTSKKNGEATYIYDFPQNVKNDQFLTIMLILT